jgi:hypothetical protein
MSHRSFHKPTELTYRRRRRRSTSSPRGWSLPHRLHFEPLEDRRRLAVIPVTNLDDFGPGSLRQAIFDANNMGGADTIDLTGVAGTIAVAAGEMEIVEQLTLEGRGAELADLQLQYDPG